MLHLADQGVRAGPAAVPGDARRHRPQLRRGHRDPRRAGRPARRAPGGGQRRRRPSTPAASSTAAPSAQPAADGDPARAIRENKFDAAFGGARRDEEKARAKERVFSFRDEFGQWDPKAQRPELWNLYNGRHRKGEHIRVFPLSNWTELDIWQLHRRRGHRRCRPSTTRTARQVFRRDGMLLAVHEYIAAQRRGEVVRDHVRFRTVGDVTCTGCVESAAVTVEEVIAETARRPHHRTRRHPRRRPHLRGRHGRPQAGGLLLMTHDAARPSFATAGSRRRRQVHADRPAAATTPRPSWRTSSPRRADVSRERGNDYTDLALVTDGLRAEREQGITIDVAYRYFATPSGNSSSPTAPGHIQYTRNMVTGASTVELVIVLVDARHGVVEQTRRHSVPGLAARRAARRARASTRWTSSTATRTRFDGSRDEFTEFAAETGTRATSPSSRSPRSTATTWSTVADTCRGTRAAAAAPPRNVYIASDRNLVDARFPVQYVIRPATPSTPTTAAMPARWPAARSGRATRSWCCPAD